VGVLIKDNIDNFCRAPTLRLLKDYVAKMKWHYVNNKNYIQLNQKLPTIF